MLVPSLAQLGLHLVAVTPPDAKTLMNAPCLVFANLAVVTLMAPMNACVLVVINWKMVVSAKMWMSAWKIMAAVWEVDVSIITAVSNANVRSVIFYLLTEERAKNDQKSEINAVLLMLQLTEKFIAQNTATRKNVSIIPGVKCGAIRAIA